ncbi:CMP-N-acetylneuraminate-beta-galactosamide-alpha-2,3-sialyltransferase 1-like [Oscarella lobularis]|uniref:CMP-N-acetylneuraminate-beta-galactosamide- alpha-2,3-sialyltransferase 1-like n=1 Tax=Oscarella lobularis TaxID=121494 RepID=UPI0033141DEB
MLQDAYRRRTRVFYVVLIVTTISVGFHLVKSTVRVPPPKPTLKGAPRSPPTVKGAPRPPPTVKGAPRPPPTVKGAPRPPPTLKGAPRPPPRPPTTRVAAKPTPLKCRDIGALLADPNLPPVIRSKYHSDVKVMLTENTKTLDPKIGNWWRHLQPFKSDRDFTELANDLFTVIPGADPFLPSISCRRCAVVGTAGNLRGAGHGKEIDSFDAVIRMNSAPIKGYENDVGTKTTYHLVYPESALSYGGEGKLVLFPFKVLDIEWLRSVFSTHHISRGWTRVPTHVNTDASNGMVIHPEFIHYVSKTWFEGKGRWTSAGGLALIWALHVCNEVDVFGFGRNKYGNWDHYYDKRERTGVDPFRRTHVHDADIEENVRTALNESKIIRFHPGNP